MQLVYGDISLLGRWGPYQHVSLLVFPCTAGVGAPAAAAMTALIPSSVPHLILSPGFEGQLRTEQEHQSRTQAKRRDTFKQPSLGRGTKHMTYKYKHEKDMAQVKPYLPDGRPVSQCCLVIINSNAPIL